MTAPGWTFYSLATGELVRTVERSENVPTCFDGEGCVQGVFDLRSCVVDLCTGQVKHRGLRPTPWHRWDSAQSAWIDPRLPEQVQAQAWAEVRTKRDKLLAQCDWVALRATEQGEPVPSAWLSYRQALRDITQQADPNAIEWPAIPTGT